MRMPHLRTKRCAIWPDAKDSRNFAQDLLSGVSRMIARHQETEWDGDRIALEIQLTRALRTIRELNEMVRNRDLLIDELVHVIRSSESI